MKIGLKVSLLFFFSAFIMSSCSSSSERRVLCVDMRECSGLDDDSRYQMVIYDPNDPASCDTVFWQGDKVIEHKVKMEDCLAFVEVGKQEGAPDYYSTLFRSVVALDGERVTIKLSDANSVLLSGSRSNELISKFVHEPLEGVLLPDLNEEDYMTALYDFCTKEIERHPDDLYGAYMYSLKVLMHMYRISGLDSSMSVEAGSLLDEIEKSDAYSVSHCVVAPFLQMIMLAGDLSPYVSYELISYLFLFTNR